MSEQAIVEGTYSVIQLSEYGFAALNEQTREDYLKRIADQRLETLRNYQQQLDATLKQSIDWENKCGIAESQRNSFKASLDGELAARKEREASALEHLRKLAAIVLPDHLIVESDEVGAPEELLNAVDELVSAVEEFKRNAQSDDAATLVGEASRLRKLADELRDDISSLESSLENFESPDWYDVDSALTRVEELL